MYLQYTEDDVSTAFDTTTGYEPVICMIGNARQQYSFGFDSRSVVSTPLFAPSKSKQN